MSKNSSNGEESKESTPMEKSEPGLGDPGVVDADDDKAIMMTDEEKKNMEQEKTNMNIRESEL